MNAEQPKGNLLRSIGAVVAGSIVGAGLAIGTDTLLRIGGVLPKLGQPMSDDLFYLATAYRLIYAVVGSYVLALLAPNRPMFHVLIGGILGTVVSIVGAVVTWNMDPPLGPHWYPIALTVTALLCAWLGGKLRLRQMDKTASTGSTLSI